MTRVFVLVVKFQGIFQSTFVVAVTFDQYRFCCVLRVSGLHSLIVMLEKEEVGN